MIFNTSHVISKSTLKSQVDVYFVNYRENFDYAKATTLTEPVEAYLCHLDTSSEEQGTGEERQMTLRRVKYPNRPDFRGMQSFLIRNGFIEDSTNYATKKISNLKIFEIQ